MHRKKTARRKLLLFYGRAVHVSHCGLGGWRRAQRKGRCLLSARPTPGGGNSSTVSVFGKERPPPKWHERKDDSGGRGPARLAIRLSRGAGIDTLLSEPYTPFG